MLAAVIGSLSYVALCLDNPDLTIETSPLNFVFSSQDGVIRAQVPPDSSQTPDPCLPAQSCVLAVHGVMYSPDRGLYWNPFATVYDKMRRGLPDQTVEAIAWESSTFEYTALFEGGEGPDSTILRRIVPEADSLTAALPGFLSQTPARHRSAICHSLGCRVLLHALENTPTHTIDRIVMLNAAVCDSDPAWASAHLDRVQVLAIWTADDVPLQEAEGIFCNDGGRIVGLGAVPAQLQDRWSDVDYDGGGLVVGCRLCLSNPHRFFSHLYSYESDDFWPVIRDFLAV